MNQRVNRKAVVLSAIATTVALVGIGAATLVANPPAVDANAAVPAAQPVVIERSSGLTSAQAEVEIAAYRAQLSEAYRALQQAYAQIDALQNGPAQPAESRSWDDDEDTDADHDHIVFENDHDDDHEDDHD